MGSHLQSVTAAVWARPQQITGDLQAPSHLCGVFNIAQMISLTSSGVLDPFFENFRLSVIQQWFLTPY